MHDLSPLQRLQIETLGRLYAFAYVTSIRRFLSGRLSSWIKLGTLTLFFVSLLLGWPVWITLSLLALTVWVRFFYWRARRRGYSRFVPEADAVAPPESSAPLPPNKRIKLRATGAFALSTREESVLLRPAEYWRVPLGDHVVMAEKVPGTFLYQFFNGETVEQLEVGWLVFGQDPLRTLAITFCTEWGPEFTDLSQLYYVGNGDGAPCQQRTILLSFEDEAALTAVWQTIHRAQQGTLEP